MILLWKGPEFKPYSCASMDLTADWLKQNLVLVVGKGGVGKSTLAQAAAHALAARGKRTLLCRVLQMSEAEQVLRERARNLWEVTLNPTECFREYVAMKLRVKTLATFILGNRVMQYLGKAAPGVREMVLLGKFWHERTRYDHVVVDMPSTGYALTMLHTPFNFASLFPGGPIYHDAMAMIGTLSDPVQTAIVAVALAEEMPVQESLELAAKLRALMPKNVAWLVMNRLISSPEAVGLDFAANGSRPLHPALAALSHRLLRVRAQKEVLDGLAGLWRGHPPVLIPEIQRTAEAERVREIEALVRA